MTNPSQELKQLIENWRKRTLEYSDYDICADELEDLLPTIAAEFEELERGVWAKFRLLPSDVRGALIQVYGRQADSSKELELAEVLTLAIRNRAKIEAKQAGAREGEGR